jgi:hypothetical protein
MLLGEGLTSPAIAQRLTLLNSCPCRRWRASLFPDCGPNRVRPERMKGIGEEISEILSRVS